MQVLYIGSERRDAQAIATALRGLDQAVTVSWAAHLDHMARWLDDNRDLAALVVEAPVDNESWASVVTRLQRLTWHPAVVVIIPEGIDIALDSYPDACCIRRNQSLFRDLPVVITRAMERAARKDLEQQLARASAALQDAEQRHRVAVATADRQLGELQAQYEIGMQRAAATWDMVDEQLRTAALEVERARQSQASAAADVERITRQLVEADATVEAAHARTEHARLAASEQLAQRQREFDAQIAQEADRRGNLERLLEDASEALDDAEQRHASNLSDATERTREVEATLQLARRDLEARAADIERLAACEEELNARLVDVIDSRAEIERRLAATEAAFDDAVTRATRERLAVSKKAAEREAELDGQIQQERATRATLEQARADDEIALRNVQAARDTLERQLADATSAIQLSAEARADLDAQLQQERGAGEALEQALDDAESALEQARRDHQSAAADVQRLIEREADLTSQIADVQAARDILERLLADATSAIQQAAEQRAALDAQMLQELGTRKALEQAIDDAEIEIEQVRREHESATADVQRLTAREADLLSQLADGETALHDAKQRHDAALAAAATEFAEHQARLDRELLVAADECDRLTEQLSDAGVSLDQARQDYESAVADVEHATRREAALESELAEIRTERDTVEQSLAEARAQALEQEQQFNIRLAHEQLEHESRLADVQEQTRTLAIDRDALQQSLKDLQDRSRQLQETLAASVEAFEASRADGHRLFEQAGLAMFRCTPDGTLIDANRACATLVGRRALDELRGAQFPASVFDAPNALFWLIERCESTRVKETVEATWRRSDGGRLFVRLSARSTGPEVIEFVAEDFTRVRILEERLSQAHRMEAVGRLAAEVAVTCGTLLSDIHENGREWLAGVAVDSRPGGERLLDDVRRAAALMQELAACGDEQQARTPMLVDLNTLIRDLEPVLKRVAGGEVEVQLQDSTSPLNVDVGTERIERLLVNLASYGRGRMPSGGQLRIELGKSVVDRRFAAKHPNVRLGLHALITVTEIRRVVHTDEPSPRRPRNPGVDFGTLQGLVSECGGHLWMKVQPPGEMVAKIRLPLSSPQGETLPRAMVTRGRRERLSARLFQS